MKYVFLLTLLSINSAWAKDQIGTLIKSMDKIGKQPDVCDPPAKSVLDKESLALANKKWFEGARDCHAPGAKTPPYEILQVNKNFYVMRQNKCINFEAPFLYLYVGTNKALLLDTGATGSQEEMPLRKWVDETLNKLPNGKNLELIVAHSHSHGDHMAGDAQFEGRPKTTVVGNDPASVAKAFGIKKWPDDIGSIDLGGRKLSIIPIPGHEDSSIAIYDHKKGDLLTGDTIYPGNIFLSESKWSEFKDSINRLHKFSEKNKVRNILGAHIEMSSEPGVDFTYGATHHPNEHKLPLRQEHLNELKKHLDGANGPAYKKFDDIIINL